MERPPDPPPAPCPSEAPPATDQPGLLRPRTREKRPELWKRVVRKSRRVAGKEYVNTKGQVVKPKEIGAACTCRMKCYNRVDESTRQTIFSGYYALQSYDEQNAYLFGLIRRTEIARRGPATSERRTCNYQYFVRRKGRQIQVCKQAFANIHAITFKKIRMLSQKLDQNVMFPRDQRGKHMNRKKISEQVKDQVRRHISDILRSPELREFLKEDKVYGRDVNLAKMHKDYLKRFEPMAFEDPSSPYRLRDGAQTEVKIWLYSTIYHNEFRLSNLNALRVWQQKPAKKEGAEGPEGPGPPVTKVEPGAGDVKPKPAPRRRVSRKKRITAALAGASAPPPGPPAATPLTVLEPPPAPAAAAVRLPPGPDQLGGTPPPPPPVTAAPVVVHHLLPEQPAPPDLMNLAVEQLVFQTPRPAGAGAAESTAAPLQLCLPISCVQPLNLQAQPLDLHHPHTVFSVQTGPESGAGDGGGAGGDAAQAQFESAPQDAGAAAMNAGAAAITVQDYGGAEVHLVTSAAGGGGGALYDWQLAPE